MTQVPPEAVTRYGENDWHWDEVELATINLSQSHRLQTRDPSGSVVDADTVERYAEAYRAGAEFPPIVLNRVDGDLVLLCGVHRTTAAIEADVKTHSAIVFDGLDERRALLIAYTDNITHGLPTTRRDRTRQAALLVERGHATFAHAAAACAVDIGMVRSQVAVDRATERVTPTLQRQWSAMAFPSKVEIARLHHAPLIMNTAVAQVTRHRLPVATVREVVHRILVEDVSPAQAAEDAALKLRGHAGRVTEKTPRPAYGDVYNAVTLILGSDIAEVMQADPRALIRLKEKLKITARRLMEIDRRISEGSDQ